MVRAGDVVVLDFVGATGTKRRPAVVVSSELYHQNRPDLIVGLLTSQVTRASGPTDYTLSDWQAAGLDTPSAFRAFLITRPSADVRRIGRLSDEDWQAVAGRCRLALDISQSV